MEYPIKFEKCPVCGCTETIINNEVKEAIEAGKLREGKKIPAMITVANIFDPNDPKSIMLISQEVDLIRSFYDICANPECGIMRCLFVEKGRGVVERETSNGRGFGPPGRGLPPGAGVG